MKVVSFDVGIKNMAYCVFEIQENITNSRTLNIIDWNVLNLMDNEPLKNQCTCLCIPKSKKLVSKPCIKMAKYKKHDQYYCEKHAKTNTQYLLPNKQRSMTGLKKLKVDELIKLGCSHHLFSDIENLSKILKKDLLNQLNQFFEKQCFEPVVEKKAMGAGDVDLVKIGKNMKNLLNQIVEMEEVNIVVIENQISPIANRMKTVQGMLAQYFIMKNSDIQIDFISSANKLKQFINISNTNIQNNSIIIKVDILENTIVLNDSNKKVNSVNPNYKEHKQDGIYYCSKILENNLCFQSWKGSLETKKKDDLADSFLQGLWYFKHQNIISYA